MESPTSPTGPTAPAVSPDLFPTVIDKNATSFEAGGHTYFIEQGAELSLIRQRWLEKFALLAMTGRDAAALVKEARQAYDSLNKDDKGGCFMALANIIKGGVDFQARYSPILYVCTLFINREDEDRGVFDEEFAKQKIEAWMDARLASPFFFGQALNFLGVSGSDLDAISHLFSVNQSAPLDLQTPSEPMSVFPYPSK